MNEKIKKLKKAVFIDDDPTTNEYHRNLLERMKLAETVEFYGTAEKALDVCRAITDEDEFPELILVDIGLPKMTGHELALAIREIPAYRQGRTHICFLTASKDIRDVIKADENLFEHYFWKPLDARKIEQLMAEAFGNVSGH